MAAKEFLRIVVLRRGKVKPVEFRLRSGEKGLSLFAHVVAPSPTEVIRAVRGAGKQGHLAAVVVTERELHSLGLVLISTPGGTPVPEVNAVHYEARLPWWRRLVLWLRGRQPIDFFNEHAAPRLADQARVIAEEDEA